MNCAGSSIAPPPDEDPDPRTELLSCPRYGGDVRLLDICLINNADPRRKVVAVNIGVDGPNQDFIRHSGHDEIEYSGELKNEGRPRCRVLAGECRQCGDDKVYFNIRLADGKTQFYWEKAGRSEM